MPLLAERSITRAGARLHLSQSAMSGALARLRAYFGDDLLVQVRREMVPTPLAERLRPRVRAILLEIQATMETRLDFDPSTAKHHFRIATSDYVQMVMGEFVLERAEKDAPGVTFEFLRHSDPPRELLNGGQVDLLIVPPPFSAKDHPSEELFQDDMVCVIWEGNRLVGESLSMERYLELSHVAVRFSFSDRSAAFQKTPMAALDNRRHLEIITPDFNTAMHMVLNSDRVATCPRRLAMYHARFLPIRVLPLPCGMPPLVELMQWHRYQRENPALNWLRKFLMDVLAPSRLLNKTAEESTGIHVIGAGSGTGVLAETGSVSDVH